ncbi:MAG: N-glycosylase/DNA lyase [Candidatus Pacearchaeota archaeon]|jgi:N-glycosylase/DNA lyase
MVNEKTLIQEIKELEKTNIKNIVENRLKQFQEFKTKDYQDWFSELCFCILTANSKARTAINIQNQLGFEGFSKYSQKELSTSIRVNKHRFHNNKAKFIICARDNLEIKDKIKNLIENLGETEAREWLVKNIKGLGYKEASHFLRNVGYTNLAILDRHILNLMVENNYLKEKPKSLNKKNYLEIESKFKSLAEDLHMSPAKLDLYMWYMKAGEVLK